jgi:hypothetical protein
MNATILTRFVKSGALIASVAIVATIASLINVQASPSSERPVYELPRVMITAPRATIVELPRVVVTGRRVTSTDSNVAERAASKAAARS